MGGRSSPARAITQPIKKVVEEVKKKPAESAGKFLGGIPSVLASEGFKATTGKKADAFFNPIGTAAGAAGEKFVDQPKAMAKQHKEDMARASLDQQRQLDDFNRQSAQTSAEEAAADRLISDRAAQRRRRAKSGREATILSQKLGESGVEGRKTLLGL